MTTTILTDEQIESIAQQYTVTAPDGNVVTTGPWQFARAIEQAVLQSPEVQAWKKDAERLDWLDDRACCADWVEDEPIKRVIQHEDGDEFYGATWRDAIDAAMEKQP